jgi:GxxExxY protein
VRAKSFVDDLEYRVTGACIEVHRVLGAGLLESICHKCLEKELHLKGIEFVSNQIVLVNYKWEILDTELRADLIIEDCLVAGLKAVESIFLIYEA